MTLSQANQRFFTVKLLCQVMKVSRRGYYAWLNRPPSARELVNQALLAEIRRIFHANREVYGAPRIHKALRESGVVYSLNRVARLMREAKIIPKTVKKFKLTTDSRNSRHPANNLLAQNFSVSGVDQKWLADVTYIPTREGWLFLAAILDLFSRKIVGWSMGERLTSELAQQALKHAIAARSPGAGLIIHSDQGREYYAAEYQGLLEENNLVCSMSRKGNCYDNAPMESFFHSLKVEQVHHDDYRTRNEARSTLFDYIEILYNRQRLHSSIGYLSPDVFEKRAAA